MSPANPLSRHSSDSNPLKKGFRATFQIFCWEGAFAMAYDTWLNPVNYLAGLAGELHVRVVLITLLVMIPSIGAIGQLAGALLFRNSSSLKRSCITLAAIARTLWAVPLIVALIWHLRSTRTGTAFPVSEWFLVVVLVAVFIQLLAQTSGNAWLSWVKSIVPSHIQGRFFGTRQRYNMAAVIIANLLGAFWVSWKPEGVYLGYAILGTAGLFAAWISTYLLGRIPDAPPQEHPVEEPKSSYLQLVLEPLKDERFRKVLFFGATFTGAMQLAGPFFPYYFTSELKLPMSTVAVWFALTNVGVLLAGGFWGRRIDRSSRLGSVVWVTAHYMCLSPLPYLITNTAVLKWVGPIEYFLNGVMTSGYTVAMLLLLFKHSPRKNNTIYFSIYTASAGIIGATCAFVGGHLATLLIPIGGFRALWVIGSSLRLFVLWKFHRVLVPKPTSAPLPQDPAESKPAFA